MCCLSRNDTNLNFLDHKQGILSIQSAAINRYQHYLQGRQLTASKSEKAVCKKTKLRDELLPKLEVDDAGSAHNLQLSYSRLARLPRTWQCGRLEHNAWAIVGVTTVLHHHDVRITCAISNIRRDHRR